MRKKCILAFVLTAVMGISILGCSRKTADGKDKEAASEATAINDNDAFNTEENGNTEQVAETETYSFPQFEVTHYYYDNGDDYLYFNGSYDIAAVTGEDYPELKNAVDEWFANFKNIYLEEAAKSVDDAKDIMDDENYDMGSFSLDEEVKVTRSDEEISSISIRETGYSGGVHGYSCMYGVTFDSKTGKEISFEDLGDIKDDVKTYVKNYVSQRRQEGYTYDFFEDNIDNIMDNPVWYLNGFGLNIIFNEYEIGCYAEGRTIVTIPYEDLPGFNDSYRLSGKAMYGELGMNEYCDIDVDGNGTKEKVMIAVDYKDVGDNELAVKIDSLSLDLGYCSYVKNAYFVKATNGRSFILVSYDAMSDDFVTELVEVTSGTPELKDTHGFGSVSAISGDEVVMYCTLYSLGTYCAAMNYNFAGGSFVKCAEKFIFNNWDAWTDSDMVPVTKVPVKVMIEKDGELVEQELPEGTRIKPIDTDYESVLGFELEDGTRGELHFVRDDGVIYIDGVSEYDCFDNMPYAG